eukprot:5561764-Amphidinium_carterae.1
MARPMASRGALVRPWHDQSQGHTASLTCTSACANKRQKMTLFTAFSRSSDNKLSVGSRPSTWRAANEVREKTVEQAHTEHASERGGRLHLLHHERPPLPEARCLQCQ